MAVPYKTIETLLILYTISADQLKLEEKYEDHQIDKTKLGSVNSNCKSRFGILAGLAVIQSYFSS